MYTIYTDITPIAGTPIIVENNIPIPITDTNKNKSSNGIGYYIRLFTFGFCIALTASMLIPMPLDLAGVAGTALSNGGGVIMNSGTDAGTGFQGIQI